MGAVAAREHGGSLACEAVDVGGLGAGGVAVPDLVNADVPDAEVVQENEQEVWAGVRCSCEGRGMGQGQPPST